MVILKIYFLKNKYFFANSSIVLIFKKEICSYIFRNKLEHKSDKFVLTDHLTCIINNY